MTDEPANAEVLRALDKLERQVDSRFRELRDEMNRRFAEQTFVPAGVFEEYRRAAGERLGSVEKDVGELHGRNARINQLIMASFVAPVVVALVVAALLAALR